MTLKSLGASFVALTAVAGIGATGAQAQTGVLHRHPTLSGVAAGVAAHHAAKKGASNRRAAGRKPNFAERHPVLSGVAAGAATHHLLKKH